MRKFKIAGPAAAFLCLGMAAPTFATEPVVAGTAIHASPSEKAVTPAAKPAATCLNDLLAFHEQMQKDGYWLGGSGDAYGYPVGDVGYGYGYDMGPYPLANQTRYPDVRPGYEVRTLVAAANILARHGQQQPCEDVLATTKNIYTVYVADLHGSGAPRVGEQHSRRKRSPGRNP